MRYRMILAFWGWAAWMHAQEFYAEVKVRAPSVKTTNQEIFTELQEQLVKLINNTAWSETPFRGHERIPASFVLEIRQMNGDQFKGILYVNVSRPVLHSTYLTPLLVHQDQEVQFTYTQFQPLEYSEGSYDNDLVAIMAYYAYFSLGVYWDSFGKLAGTPFFQKARNLVQLGLARGAPGWTMEDVKRQNRYWLLESWTEPSYQAIREVYYDYHRKGMDKFYEHPETARAAILDALRKLHKLYEDYPRAMPLRVFIRSKREEIIEIFSEAPVAEKTEVVEMMSDMDPSYVNEYRKLMK